MADGVNVGYDVYRIKTEIGEQGGKVDAGFYVDYRDKATREVRWSQLEETLEYTAQDLDRSVVVRDQIRTVIRAYKERQRWTCICGLYTTSLGLSFRDVSSLRIPHRATRQAPLL